MQRIALYPAFIQPDLFNYDLANEISNLQYTQSMLRTDLLPCNVWSWIHFCVGYTLYVTCTTR